MVVKVVRITQNGKSSNYIRYGQRLYSTATTGTIEASSDLVLILIAEGRAATKAIIVCEAIKSLVQNLKSTCLISEIIKNDKFVSRLEIRLQRHTDGVSSTASVKNDAEPAALSGDVPTDVIGHHSESTKVLKKRKR